jgi:hypothetical protein
LAAAGQLRGCKSPVCWHRCALIDKLDDVAREGTGLVQHDEAKAMVDTLEVCDVEA